LAFAATLISLLVLSIALFGADWRALVGSLLFSIPIILAWYSSLLPNSAKLWRVLPVGLPKIAFSLFVLVLAGYFMALAIGLGVEMASWFYVVASIAMLALSVVSAFGRQGSNGEPRWIEQPHLVWLYRIGGFVLLVFTLKLAGVI
jgi:hypothetical protein